MEKRANFCGRLVIVGRAVGALRIGYGAVKAAFCAIAAFFALVGFVATSCSANTRQLFFNASRFLAEESLDGLQHLGRGCVEIIPILGSIILATYDSDNI